MLNKYLTSLLGKHIKFRIDHTEKVRGILEEFDLEEGWIKISNTSHQTLISDGDYWAIAYREGEGEITVHNLIFIHQIKKDT